MAISATTFVRATLILLLSGLLVLLALVGLTFWLAVLTQEYSAEVANGRAARSVLVDTRDLLQDMETGQRGYLLTREESYLEPYEQARGALEGRMRQLDDLRGRDRESIERLKGLLARKAAELAETISLARQGRTEEALKVVGSGAGKQTMDEARLLFARLLREVDERLQDSKAAQDGAILALRWAVGLGAILIIVVVGGSAALAARYTRELMQARADISALNADLERRVRQRTSDLTRANEEIQQFAYVVSHDLRSPLVNVIGFTREIEELGEEIFDPAGPSRARSQALATEFREATAFISSSVTKMDGLISAILKIARENGRRLLLEPVPLSQVAQAAADGVRHRLDERGGSIDVRRDMPTIVTDRMAVEQIISNLVDNAVKYAHPDRPPRITVEGSREQDRVALTVEDNGRGIAAEDQDKVFGLFKRIGRSAEAGEGIGLSHVRALARRLGGDVTLASEPDVGSRFTVVLPASAPTA